MKRIRVEHTPQEIEDLIFCCTKTIGYLKPISSDLNKIGNNKLDRITLIKKRLQTLKEELSKEEDIEVYKKRDKGNSLYDDDGNLMINF